MRNVSRRLALLLASTAAVGGLTVLAAPAASAAPPPPPGAEQRWSPPRCKPVHEGRDWRWDDRRRHGHWDHWVWDRRKHRGEWKHVWWDDRRCQWRRADDRPGHHDHDDRGRDR